MRIRELHIDSYGGLSGLHLDLCDGFNLVFGDNEAGKSTIFSFIRAQLYGLNGSARKLAENERKRLMPWDQNRMGGRLVLESGGRTYRIERSFGRTRSQDVCRLFDETTGESIDVPRGQEIGDFLFAVGEAEFGNTVSIGQLATVVDDPDDGTLAKLMNLATTGDERVSYQSVDDRLRKATVACKAERGSGGLLNELATSRQQLLEERLEALKQESERSDLIQAHQAAMRKQAELGRLIGAGRRLLAAGRDQMALYQSEQLADQLDRLHEMERQAAELRRTLVLDGRAVDPLVLESLQDRRATLRAREAKLAELCDSLEQRRLELAGLEAERAELEPIARIDRAAAQAAVSEAGLLERDLLSLSQRQLPLIELQKDQMRVLEQSGKARQQCEQAEHALDSLKEESAAALQEARDEAEKSHQAWQAFLARQPVAAGHARKPAIGLLVTGIILIMVALAGVISQVPALLVLAVPGLALVAAAWRHPVRRPPTGDSVGDSAHSADGTRLVVSDDLRTNTADVLKQAWLQDLKRLESLQVRYGQRTQAYAEKLADADRGWQAAAAAERAAAADWSEALNRLRVDPLWRQSRFLSLIDAQRQAFPNECPWPLPASPDAGEPEAPVHLLDDGIADARTVQRLTSQAAEWLNGLKVALQRRQEETGREMAVWLAATGCRSDEQLIQQLDRLERLEQDCARQMNEIELEDRQASAAADATRQLAQALQGDLLLLAGPAAEPESSKTLDELLSSVRRRHAEAERLDASISAQRQALAFSDSQAADGHASQPESLDSTDSRHMLDAARLRLRQLFPVEPDDLHLALATALEGWLSDASAAADPECMTRPPDSLASQLALTPVVPAPASAMPETEVLIRESVRLMPAILEQLQGCHGQQETAAAGIASELRHRFSLLRSLEDIDLDLDAIDQRLERIRFEHEALQLARQTVDQAFRELQLSFGPQLNRRGGEILSRLTDGRHGEMRVDRSLRITMPDPKTGQLHEFDYLSGGTIDQAYLALRLAVAELIGSRTDRLPLFLDDVLMQYDDRRAEAALAFLGEYAVEAGLQILLFTCHGRALAGVAGRVIHI